MQKNDAEPDAAETQPDDLQDINLLVSCPNDGGLVRVKNGLPIYIDNESTTGICMHGGRLFRCIQNTKDTPLKMIVYGRHGTTKLVFPEIRDVHDIMSHNGRLFLVSTGSNEIFEVSPDSYEILTRYRMKGKGDAWHLNCLGVYHGRVVVSAFGKFRRHRGYKGRTAGAGMLFDLVTGRVLFKGFSQAHSPHIIDDHLFICNSEEKTVHRIDIETGVRTILEFENYTRGIAVSDEHICVGISSSRNVVQENMQSKIAVLERRTLERIDEIRLDFSEIYTLISFPEDLEFPAVRSGIPRLVSMSQSRDANVKRTASSKVYQSN